MSPRFPLRSGWLPLALILLWFLLPACSAGKSPEENLAAGKEALQAKNYEKAIASFSEAIKQDPKSIKAYNNRGIAYCEKGDLDQAIADFTQVIKLDPKNGKAYNNRAVAYWQKGNQDQALQDANQAKSLGIAVNPQFLEMLTKPESPKK